MMNDGAIGMTQDQAIELHDAYWYAQCAMEGVKVGREVRGEKAKASSRVEAMRLALMSFEAAGATVDAARFSFGTPAELEDSAAELMVEVCAHGNRCGVYAPDALPVSRACPCCGRAYASWSAHCADCGK